MVIRSASGLVMASLSQQIPLPHTVHEVEAPAARRALQFALFFTKDDKILLLN